MEAYILFNLVSSIANACGVPTSQALYWGVGVGFVAWLALFTLQGYGLYRMAKNRNLKKKWLAFVPFANLYYMEKLTGACDVFGQKVKHMGLYTMIAQIVTVLIAVLTIATEIYLYTACGVPQYDQYNIPHWENLTGFSVVCYNFFTLSSYISSIFQLVYEILVFVLCLALYKKYAPKNYFALGMLTLFLPLSRFIVIFVIRNRKAIDYDAYMRARYDAYMRSRGYGYNNPYGNAYSNPYNQGNPYANNANRPQQPTEEPFAEFGGVKENQNNENPFGDEFGEQPKNNQSPFDDFD